MPHKYEIKDAFHRIGFKGQLLDFDRLYPVNSLNIDVIAHPSYWNILNRYVLHQIENNKQVKKRRIDTKSIGKKRLKQSITLFLEGINQRINNKKYELKYLNKIQNNFLIHINHIRTSNIQQIRKTKANDRDTDRFFSIYLDLNNKILSIYAAERYLLSKLYYWIQAKIKFRLEPLSQEEYGNVDIKNLLSDDNIKVFEIGLRQTQFNESDKIIVVSRRGHGKNYLEKVRQTFLDNRELTLYDIGHVKISYKDSPPVHVRFERKRSDSININILLTVPDNQIIHLPPQIQNYVKNDIVLYDKVPEKIMLSNIMQRGYVNKMEFFNPSFHSYIAELEKINIISYQKNYRYFCSNPSCPYKSRIPMIKSECKCGTVTKKEFTEFYSIDINHKKIIKELRDGIRSCGYSCIKMPKKYLGLKETDILRLTAGEQDVFVIVNKKGLSKNKVEELTLLGLPIILINLKGEIRSTMPNFEVIDSSEMVYCLLKKDYLIIPKFLEDIKDRSFQLKLSSFKECLKKLRNKDYGSPIDFEKIVFGLMNFIFMNVRRWGGKHLADGSFAIKFKIVRYGLWDAKRYLKTSLKKYIKKQALKKDIKYMESFSKNQVISRFGNLSLYSFITANMSKEDFIEMSSEMALQILNSKTLTKLKKCKIGCIDAKELEKLASFYLHNFERIADHNQASKIIYNSIIKNEGYFIFDQVKEHLIRVITKRAEFPETKEIRKETAELMNVG